jgi:hypothetical protein
MRRIGSRDSGHHTERVPGAWPRCPRIGPQLLAWMSGVLYLVPPLAGIDASDDLARSGRTLSVTLSPRDDSLAIHSQPLVSVRVVRHRAA